MKKTILFLFLAMSLVSYSQTRGHFTKGLNIEGGKTFLNDDVYIDSALMVGQSITSAFIIATEGLSKGGDSLPEFADTLNKLATKYDVANQLVVSVFFPTTLTVATGTLEAGVVGDLNNLYNDSITIEEASGADPLRFTLTFTDVGDFDKIVFYGKYSGTASHTIAIEMYNYTLTRFDTLYTITDQGLMTWTGVPVFDPNSYVSAGTAVIKFKHNQSGNTSHHYYLDYIYLSKGGAVSGGASVHSGLGGVLGSGEYHLSEAEQIVATQAATTSLDGYLTDTDWDTFNNKENALTFTSPINRATNTISLTGLTGFGTSGQVIATNATTNGLEWKDAGGTAADISVTDESGELASFPLFVTAATGALDVKTNAGLTFFPATSNLGATLFTANTAFIPDANNGATLGVAATGEFSDIFIADGAVINWNNGDALLYQDNDTLYVYGADFDIGVGSLKTTGSIASTTDRVLKGWFTDIESTNLPTVNGGSLKTALGLTATDVGLGNVTNESKATMFTSPTFTGTPVLGAATGTSLDVSGVLESGANSGTNGQLKLYGSTSGDVTIKAAAAAGTATVFQLPATNGSNTNVLQTDGTGVTSWVAAGTVAEKSYALTFGASSQSTTTDAQTMYWGNMLVAPSTTANRWRIYIPKTGTIKACYIYSYAGTAGTSENWSMYIRVNNTTDNLVQTLGAATSDRIWSSTGLSIAVTAGNYIEIKEVQPTWATNPATVTRNGVIYIE